MGEGGSRRLTDEVSITVKFSIQSAHILHPRCPVSATPTHMLRICVNPRHALSAGVQTMRARICSAISCDMFARVVWLRLRRARYCQLSLCRLQHALATHYFLRLTRARRPRFARRTARVLLADFWYFSSQKSTTKKISLCIFSLSRKQIFQQTEMRLHKKAAFLP